MIFITLGTDVSGGYSCSILDSLRKAIDVSKLLSVFQPSEVREDNFIHHEDAFYLATLGGAKVMGLDDKIGELLFFTIKYSAISDYLDFKVMVVTVMYWLEAGRG